MSARVRFHAPLGARLTVPAVSPASRRTPRYLPIDMNYARAIKSLGLTCAVRASDLHAEIKGISAAVSRCKKSLLRAQLLI